MSNPKLPPCGLYRTTTDIGSVPAGRLVYFHNHGDPGPGVYLPESWKINRAKFQPKGVTLPDVDAASTLQALPPEGLYRVREPFDCCAKKCRTFGPDTLVQLGYDGGGHPLLFEPEWTELGLSFPEMGQKIDDERLALLSPLKIAGSRAQSTTSGPGNGHARH